MSKRLVSDKLTSVMKSYTRGGDSEDAAALPHRLGVKKTS